MFKLRYIYNQLNQAPIMQHPAFIYRPFPTISTSVNTSNLYANTIIPPIRCICRTSPCVCRINLNRNALYFDKEYIRSLILQKKSKNVSSSEIVTYNRVIVTALFWSVVFFASFNYWILFCCL